MKTKIIVVMMALGSLVLSALSYMEAKKSGERPPVVEVREVTRTVSVPESPVPVISDREADRIVAAGPLISQPPRSDVDTASRILKSEPTIERPLIDKGGILLKKGMKQIEPSFSYTHISSNRIAINGITILPMLIIGEIATEQVKRDVFIETITARYGIWDNLQAELRVPFRSEFDRQSNSSFSTESTDNASGLGDIDGTVLTQLLYETASSPDLIAGINVKSRTGKDPYGREIGLGTGHWAVKGTFMAVKTTDPAIIFGGAGYTWNIARDIGGSGEVDPGDSFSYNLGFAFALNYQLGLNFQLEHIITQSMTVDGDSVPGSFTNVANFKTGASWSSSKSLSTNITVGIGLTADSPDFSVEVKFPFTF